MQNDVRLIDANALPNFKCKVTATIGDQKGPAEMRFVFWQDIEKAPTIDAVEVVRCRECFYKDIPKCCPYQINGFEVVSNWYCPMGVRKMDAKDMDIPTKGGGGS